MQFRRYCISFFFLLLPVLYTQGGVCGNCDCWRSEYNTKYKKGNTFKEVGLDIYLFIRFSDYNKEDFLEKYKILYTYSLDCNEKNNINNENNIISLEEDPQGVEQIEKDIFKEAMEEKLTDDEDFFLDRFFSGKTNVLNFSNHHQEWRVHVYKLTKTMDQNISWEISDANLNDIFRKMGTTGGNNFDVAKCQDIPRWFESWRSKNRHNKNLLIVEETNSKILEDVLKKFKRMISFSYCPVMGFVYGDNSTVLNNDDFIYVENDINLEDNFDGNFEKVKKDFYKKVKEMDSKATAELENLGVFYSENEFLAENKKNIIGNVIDNEILNNENIIATSSVSNNIVQKEDKDISKNPAKEPSEASLGKLLKNDVFDEDRVNIIPYKKNEKNIWEKNIIDFIKKECTFHNNLGVQGFDPNRFYVMLVGQKRVGKTTMLNLLANARIGKTANDVTSVTGKKMIYDIAGSSLSVIDTAGFEKGADFADELLKWLKEPAVDCNGNLLEGKRNGDMINCFVYIIRPDKDQSNPETWAPTSGSFFSKEDEKLFEIIIEFKKPSIFCFNSDDTVTKAVMATRKMFGDLVFWNLSKVNTWVGNLRKKSGDSEQLCQNIAHNFFDEKVAHFTIVKLVEDKKNDLKPFGLGRLLKLIIKVCEENYKDKEDLIIDMKKNYFKKTIKYFCDKGFINDFDFNVKNQKHPFLFKTKKNIDPFGDEEDDLFPLLDSNLRYLYDLCKKKFEEQLEFSFEDIGKVGENELKTFSLKFGVAQTYKNVLINNFALGNKTLMIPYWGIDFNEELLNYCRDNYGNDSWTLLGLFVDNKDHLFSYSLLTLLWPANRFWIKGESDNVFGIGM